MYYATLYDIKWCYVIHMKSKMVVYPIRIKFIHVYSWLHDLL